MLRLLTIFNFMKISDLKTLLSIGLAKKQKRKRKAKHTKTVQTKQRKKLQEVVSIVSFILEGHCGPLLVAVRTTPCSLLGGCSLCPRDHEMPSLEVKSP